MTNLSLILLLLNICLTGIICLAIYRRYKERQRMLKPIRKMLSSQLELLAGSARAVSGNITHGIKPESGVDGFTFVEGEFLTILGTHLLPELSRNSEMLSKYMYLSSLVHEANYFIIVRRLHQILLPINQQETEFIKNNTYKLERACESIDKIVESLEGYLIPPGSLAD